MRELAALLLIAAVGCTSPEPEVPAGAWGAATVVEELSIGVEFGADEYMFGYVQSIAVAADETIYVSDQQQDIVRMYDGDGTFGRNIGRQGQGPGEYAFAPALGVLQDGTLVMADRRTSRVSFFSSSGDYLDSFTAATASPVLVVDRDGNVIVQGFDRNLVRYSPEGEELGRESVPMPDRIGANLFVLAFGEGMIYPFPTETHSAWSPLGYLVTGRNDVYDIELRKPSGAVNLTRDLASIPVGGDEHAEWKAFRQGLVERVPEGDFAPIPDVKPFFREIYVGQDGRIWVFRYVAAEKRHDIEPLPDRPERPLLTWREPWTYDVFERDGTFLGSVVVPETLRPFVFRGDRIWGALAGDDGIERVVRLRVVPEVR